MEFSQLVVKVTRFVSRYKLFLLFILLYLAFVTYFFRGITALDPDFGWRLRVGEIILNRGFPATDPFSYTMPSFPFVDHSWAMSVMIALTFPIFSNRFLSLFLAFAVFASVFIAIGRSDDDDFQHTEILARYEKWLHPMVIIVISFFFLFFSVRAQILSWLIFSLLNYLLFRKDNYSRYKYFLPLVFLIWANLHGGYFLGLILLSYFVIFRFLINRKGSWKDFLILVLSILVTLITPYGLEGWREVTSSVFDSRLRWTIAEWMPSVTFFDLSMAFYVAMSTFMVFYKRKEIAKIQYFLFWGLLAFGIASRRNMPYFMLYSLPLTVSSINKLYLEVADKKDSRERFRIAFNFIRIFSVSLLVFQMYFTYWKNPTLKSTAIKKVDFYPDQAVNYLKGKELEGKIFSNYGWGGYLIWKLPNEKVFIDGRMPSWRFTPKDTNKESPSAYDDYLEILEGELDFNKVSDKYEINYVLWPKEKEGFFENVEKRLRKAGLFGKKKDDFSFTGYLRGNGWILVYTDETAEIYHRFNGQRL